MSRDLCKEVRGLGPWTGCGLGQGQTAYEHFYKVWTYYGFGWAFGPWKVDQKASFRGMTLSYENQLGTNAGQFLTLAKLPRKANWGKNMEALGTPGWPWVALVSLEMCCSFVVGKCQRWVTESCGLLSFFLFWVEWSAGTLNA